MKLTINIAIREHVTIYSEKEQLIGYNIINNRKINYEVRKP